MEIVTRLSQLSVFRQQEPWQSLAEQQYDCDFFWHWQAQSTLSHAVSHASQAIIPQKIVCTPTTIANTIERLYFLPVVSHLNGSINFPFIFWRFDVLLINIWKCDYLNSQGCCCSADQSPKHTYYDRTQFQSQQLDKWSILLSSRLNQVYFKYVSISIKQDESLCIILKMGSNLTTRTKRYNIIQFQDKPFSSGSIRFCFKGKITAGPDKGKSAVVKAFKHPPLRTQFIDAQQQLKVYSIANDYARMFCQVLKENGWTKMISFPQPDLVRIDGLSLWTWITSNYFKSGDYICAEQYLRGEYKKFTNNTGYSTCNETMECFQHYTFVKSGFRAVVCDLQGIVEKDRYVLTDPAVNSLDQRFGNTDCGKQGMLQVLGRHKCNRICKDIGLKNNVNYDKLLPPVYNSTSKRRSHTRGI